MSGDRISKKPISRDRMWVTLQAGDIAWAGDGSLFYTRHDKAHRPFQVWRHAVGTAQREDVMVFEDLVVHTFHSHLIFTPLGDAIPHAKELHTNSWIHTNPEELVLYGMLSHAAPLLTSIPYRTSSSGWASRRHVTAL